VSTRQRPTDRRRAKQARPQRAATVRERRPVDRQPDRSRRRAPERATTPRDQPATATGERRLTLAQDAFCFEYVKNGSSNATQAYLASHPGVTYNTATVEGHRILGNPKVWARIEELWKLYQMSGEEAIARIGRIGKFDLGQLYDESGTMLPRSKWPKDAGQFLGTDDVAKGRFALPLSTRLAALRTIAEATGKVKTPVVEIDILAAALRGDLAKHGEAKSQA